MVIIPMFNVIFIAWFVIGIFCAGCYMGYNEHGYDDIDLRMFMILIVIMFLGPINLIIAIGRFVGMVGST